MPFVQNQISTDDPGKAIPGSFLNQNTGNGSGAARTPVPGLCKGTVTLFTETHTAVGCHSRPLLTTTPTKLESELQSRSSKSGNFTGDFAWPHSFNRHFSPAPNKGATSEQKQATLLTAADLYNGPSPVRMSDALCPASTFDNVRRRHGNEVRSGVRHANKLGNMYSITGYTGTPPSPADEPESGHIQERVARQLEHSQALVTYPVARKTSPPVREFLEKKKPPPPPPKRMHLAGSGTKQPGVTTRDGGKINDQPPPVPMATKPNLDG